MLDSALSWLSKGVVPLPLKPGSKRPAFPWGKLQKHKPPPAVVRSWDWSGNLNLGLLCGAVSDNLIVLDFDKVLSYAKWKVIRPKLAATYTVRTSRGYHVYLRLGTLPARTLSMEGGDVKVTGYVVGAGSTHPSGAIYRAQVPDASILSLDNLDEVGVKVKVMPEPPPIELPIEHPAERDYGLIEEIKALMPLTVYLSKLTRLYPTSPDGTWLMGNCPFHDDRNPSMWVNARWGICRCFKPSCKGAVQSMDVINCHALLRGVSNEYAIQELAAELGL